MKIAKTIINFEDERGVIRDVLIGTTVDAITYLTFKKGAVRGNHYHERSVQHDYILSGSILCRVQSGSGQMIEEAVLVPGDVITHVAGSRHAFKALEDSAMLSCTHGPRQGESFENDVVRLSGDEKLIKS